MSPRIPRRAISATLAGVMLVAGAIGFLGGNEAPPAAAASPVPDGIPQPLPHGLNVAGDRAIAPPPEQFDGPAPEPAPPPVALASPFREVTPQGGTWAVMVGVNDYPGSGHDLRSAVNDVADVDTALAGFGVPADRRLVITDRQASSATIRRSAQWLAAHAGPDATVVFFYAGHVRKLGRGTEAMVGSDGRTVADHELASLLAPMAAQKAWIGIAGCYGGGFTEVLAPGRILTGAAPSDSLAYENDAYGRSYLVEYMVNRAMIQGRANASVEQAFAWADAELRRDYPHRLPVQFDQVSGDLSLGTPVPEPATAPAEHQSSTPSTDQQPERRSGGGGSSPSPSPAPAPQPAPSPSTCQRLTLGVVHCNE